MTTDQALKAAVERERVARIIDPLKWRRFDRHPQYAAHVPRETQIEWTANLQDSLTKADLIIADTQERLDYLRTSRDGHAEQAHAEFERRVATEAALSSQASVMEEMAKALEAVSERAKVMRNAHKLVGPRAFGRDHKAHKAWADDRYGEGKEIMALTRTALSHYRTPGDRHDD